LNGAVYRTQQGQVEQRAGEVRGNSEIAKDGLALSCISVRLVIRDGPRSLAVEHIFWLLRW